MLTIGQVYAAFIGFCTGAAFTAIAFVLTRPKKKAPTMMETVMSNIMDKAYMSNTPMNHVIHGPPPSHVMCEICGVQNADFIKGEFTEDGSRSINLCKDCFKTDYPEATF